MNYIGSKHSLLGFIEEVIINVTAPLLNNSQKGHNAPVTFCDIFAGTSAVGRAFKQKGYNIIANDLQYYSYVMAKHYIQNNQAPEFSRLRAKGIAQPFEFLATLGGEKGFVYHNYSLGGTTGQEFQRLYFSDENAMKIDAIRQKIETWKTSELINEAEYFYLLASLLETADRVANTASIYEAFLKKIKPAADRPLLFESLEVIKGPQGLKHQVYNQDANSLIRQISGQILYLDPPYNTRKYNTNYHILETIALYDEPEIKGKTGMRTDQSKKSKYSARRQAAAALTDLIKSANFPYIFLSYNDEGIITLAEIEKIMSKYGEYQRFEQKHRRFKADSHRDYAKEYTIEYIHCLRRNDL